MSFSYYHDTIENFKNTDNDTIWGQMTHENDFDLSLNQRGAWDKEIELLKEAFKDWEDGEQSYIALEYNIPRLYTRIDALIIHKGCLFVIEFKVGSKRFLPQDKMQVLKYALELKDCHSESWDIPIIPILYATRCTNDCQELVKQEWPGDSVYSNVYSIITIGKNSKINEIIENTVSQISVSKKVDGKAWLQGKYHPSPNIIEAARAIYGKHTVDDIRKNNADDESFARCLNFIISQSRQAIKSEQNHIFFVSGVPGSGKTLLGLDLAINGAKGTANISKFISGNGPLVTILNTALRRDAKKHLKKFKTAEEKTMQAHKASSVEKSFVQDVFKFRKEYLDDNSGERCPEESIVIFDEAQRAWTHTRLKEKTKLKKDSKFATRLLEQEFASEPYCLIDYMSRRPNGAVIVCLIGTGQEIHNGEAGISEWFKALIRFRSWQIHSSLEIQREIKNKLSQEYKSDFANRWDVSKDLYLNVNLRSMRGQKVSAFADAVVNGNAAVAQKIYEEMQYAYKKDKSAVPFPIFITRDLSFAKHFVRKYWHKVDERYGVLASANGACRSRAEGVLIPTTSMNIVNYLLDPVENINSSNKMEIAASEFKLQGLEIDYSIVIWEADLRYQDNKMHFYHFGRNKWNEIVDSNEDDLEKTATRRNYMRNAYRVLLTRARRGLIIYIPTGSVDDPTRVPEYYDGTYCFLKNMIKLPELCCRHSI